MPASLPRCRSEGRPRPLRGDDAGASEVVGYILAFGITSMMLVASFLTFNAARSRTEDRILQVEASSLAHRVADAVVQIGLYQERHPTGAATAASGRLRLDLPSSIENRGYRIELCDPAAGAAANAKCGQSVCASGGAAKVARVQLGNSYADESLLGIPAKAGCVTGGSLFITFDSTVNPIANPALVSA